MSTQPLPTVSFWLQDVKAYYSAKGIQTMFLCAKERKKMGSIVPTALRDIKLEFRTAPTQLMVVGMPNVGKSTTINAIKVRSEHSPISLRAAATLLFFYPSHLLPL
jgi:ribosome biogenesis GTPase A